MEEAAQLDFFFPENILILYTELDKKDTFYWNQSHLMVVDISEY